MQRVKFDPQNTYQVAAVSGKPFLFEDLRIERDTVPSGLFVYEVADGDGDGCFARIQKGVLVNFWGTLIGKDPIPLENGAYYPRFGTAEYEGDFIDEMTLEEYLEADDDAFDIDPEPEVVDGEYAVFAGRKYVVICDIDPIEEEGWKQFEELAKEEFPSQGLEWLSCIRPDKKNGIESARITIRVNEDMRVMQIYDVLAEISCQAGVFVSRDEGTVVPARKEENEKENKDEK